MGHTTRISDYEIDHAATVGPETEGVDIEAQAEKAVTKSKVVEPEKRAEPKKSTARTKSK